MRWQLLLSEAICAAVLAGSFVVGCKCSDVGSVSVDPPCPNGRKASASLAMHLEPAALRPLGTPKQMRVRGNRSDSDVCIQEGALASFSKELDEPSPLDVTVGGLGPGMWHFTVTALSGGDYAPVEVNHALSPGGAATLRVAGDAGNNIQLTFGGS